MVGVLKNSLVVFGAALMAVLSFIVGLMILLALLAARSGRAVSFDPISLAKTPQGAIVLVALFVLFFLGLRRFTS